MAARIGGAGAAYSSNVSPVPRTWTLDWSIASISLSVVGAAIRLMGSAWFWVGWAFFVLGLIAGAVALRKGTRRNLAIGGIVLNVANLVVDTGFVIFAASR
jgi:hypothetical protein